MFVTGFRFINSRPFDRQWANLGLGDDELRALQSQLMFNPEAGDLVSGTGGVRKMRWAYQRGQGKRGGARVCYAFFRRHGIVYLVLIYAKADQENLRPDQKAVIKTELRQLELNIERGLI
jgi:hypothetical protein